MLWCYLTGSPIGAALQEQRTLTGRRLCPETVEGFAPNGQNDRNNALART
jgi:hypothetical protein